MHIDGEPVGPDDDDPDGDELSDFERTPACRVCEGTGRVQR